MLCDLLMNWPPIATPGNYTGSRATGSRIRGVQHPWKKEDEAVRKYGRALGEGKTCVRD